MTLKTLGPMLGEIHAMLQAKGCKVTELSVTLHPIEDDTAYQSGDIRVALHTLPRHHAATRPRKR